MIGRSRAPIGFVGVVALAATAALTITPGPERVIDHGAARLEAVGLSYRRGVDLLETAIIALEEAGRLSDAAACRDAFRQARRAYKRIEHLAEYFSHPAAGVLNGPALPRADDDDPELTLPPAGLQVVEASLFPEAVPGYTRKISLQTQLMRSAVEQLRADEPSVVGSEGRVFDALRLQLARIVTLGLAGFDATLSRDAIGEAEESLRGMRSTLEAYAADLRARDPAAAGELNRRFSAAEEYLRSHPRFETFNRLAFITGYAKPLSRSLGEAQKSLAIPRVSDPGAWSARSDGIFDAGALDASFYAPWDAAPPNDVLTGLGERLFFDPRLSSGSRRSCASCHQPARAFTDGRPRALVNAGSGDAPRNTPTLINAGLQPALFTDQRTRFLEDQVAEVMANPREMGLTPEAAAGMLRTDSGYSAAFARAFAKQAGDAISARSIVLAIAAYLRSLQALESRFDQAVRGDTLALSEAERRGFNLFMGKAACGTCHFAPLFGGATPPLMQESEPEVIGTPARVGHHNLSEDLGVGAIDQVLLHRHAFKTPSLRNVALTAPYMHNGVFRTLEQVMDFYDQGGGAGAGAMVPNQTLSPEPLRLTRGEKRDLIAFLLALSDTVVRRPAR